MKLKSKNDLGSKSNLIKRLKAASSVLRSTHFSNFLQKFLKTSGIAKLTWEVLEIDMSLKGLVFKYYLGVGGGTSSNFNS